MSMQEIIEHYGKQLKFQGKLTQAWLMYEVINELDDEQLEYHGVDIIDVAEMVYNYILHKG